MATFNLEQVVRTGNGLSATYQTLNSGGDKFSPGSGVIVHAKNTNAATRTITFTTPGLVQEFAIADMTATIPATTGDKFLGPFPPELFAGSDGLVAMTYDVNPPAGLTIAFLKING